MMLWPIIVIQACQIAHPLECTEVLLPIGWTNSGPISSEGVARVCRQLISHKVARWKSVNIEWHVKTSTCRLVERSKVPLYT